MSCLNRKPITTNITQMISTSKCFYLIPFYLYFNYDEISEWPEIHRYQNQAPWSKSIGKKNTSYFKQLWFFWSLSLSLYWQLIVLNPHKTDFRTVPLNNLLYRPNSCGDSFRAVLEKKQCGPQLVWTFPGFPLSGCISSYLQSKQSVAEMTGAGRRAGACAYISLCVVVIL